MIRLFTSWFKKGQPLHLLDLNFFFLARRGSIPQRGWRASRSSYAGVGLGRHEGSEKALALVQVSSHARRHEDPTMGPYILSRTDSLSIWRSTTTRAPRISRSCLDLLGWRMQLIHYGCHHRLPPGSAGSGCLLSCRQRHSRIRRTVSDGRTG